MTDSNETKTVITSIKNAYKQGNLGNIDNLIIRSEKLSAEEESNLVKLAQNDEGFDGQEAWETLILSYENLVRSIAADVCGSSYVRDVYVAAGREGLVAAIRNFDPESGNRLSTYAYMKIRYAISSCVAANKYSISIDEKTERDVKKFYACANRLRAEYGEEPTHEEIYSELHWTGKKCQHMDFILSCTYVTSIGSSTEEEGGSISAGRVPGSAYKDYIDSQDYDVWSNEVVPEIMKFLSPIEADVIAMKTLGIEEPTFEMIGEELGISKDKARQIYNRALNKIRSGFDFSEYGFVA